jgi:pimeloyl-ACP methyl ester carboxylesterase
MASPPPLFVLVHSPLVGPTTWEPVAVALRERDWEVAVPALWDNDTPEPPYWQQHAEAVVRGLGGVEAARPVILAGHSGAGPLLPAIGAQLAQPVAIYLFVDAGIPADGLSRLDGIRREAPEWAAEFEQELRAGGMFPAWTDADLAEIVPDAGLRRALLAELHPRALAFFTEPIPGPRGWPDAPCIYLQFSAAYDVPADYAQAAGWPIRRLEAGHFHMLVEPEAVAGAMLELVAAAQASGPDGEVGASAPGPG